MTELEQALGRLPEDAALTPEPFPAILARAERRRRRRWQGRGLASVVAVAALAVGLNAIPEGGRVVDTTTSPASRGDLPATGGRVSPSTSVALAPETTLSDDIVGPTPTTSVAEGRVPPTTPAADPDGSQSSPIQPPPSDPFLPPGSDPNLSSCPPAEVVVTVTTGKPAYAVGETVTGSSILENRSSTACLVPARVRWAVQDLAGQDVSGFAYTADYALPVRAEPGQTFPGSVTWNQTNCAGPTCTQVPPGTYVLVGRWTEGGSFSAQATFTVGT
jgi:hypothetical protein